MNIDPYSGASLSVAPLNWSHATYEETMVEYLEKQAELTA